MSFIDSIIKTNIVLISRIEGASGYPPLRDLGDEGVKEVIQRAMFCTDWDEVPEEDRRMIEAAEANKAEHFKELGLNSRS